MSTGVSAHAVVGNPTTPCSGRGFCDLEKSPMADSPMYIKVTLTSSVTQLGENLDLTINIAADQLSKLQDLRSDVYDQLVNKHKFDFPGNLVVYLCNDLTSEIWTDAPEHMGILNPACEVKLKDDGSYDIHIPREGIGTSVKGGMVTESDGRPPISTETWDIYEDVYDNLILTNDTDRNETNNKNSIIFGVGGNISTYRYSVQLDKSIRGGQTGNNQSTILVNDWTYGQDDNGNLNISHLSNPLGSMVTFAKDGENIYVCGYAIESITTMAPITSSTIPDDAVTYSFGDWTIVEDDAGNLCFKNGFTEKAFYFSAVGPTNADTGIYLHGAGSIAITGFPSGMSTPDKIAAAATGGVIAGSGGASGVPA